MACDGDPATVRDRIAAVQACVVLTGAGVSTDSGIPDFRGPQGVWTKYPDAERLATLQVYLADPEVRRQAWKSRLHSPVWQAEPNAAHRALARLDAAGRLDVLVTQNIDGLHQAAGVNAGRVLEIHGTMHRAMCWACKRRYPMREVLDRVAAGEDDPRCTARSALEVSNGGSAGAPCGGILKSDTISFGQNLEPDVLEAASFAASRAELFLAIGSSLSVQPAAGLVPLAAAHGAAVVIVNAEETPYDGLADLVLHGPVGEILPAIVP